VWFGKEPTLNCWFFQKFPKPGTKINLLPDILKIFKNPEPDIITKSKNHPILKLNTTLSSFITSELQPLTSGVFLISKFSQKFDRFKGFFMGKMVQICQISKRKKFKSPDFYSKFHR
jgi:hypothetical protein